MGAEVFGGVATWFGRVDRVGRHAHRPAARAV